jgi:hypothetical protein
MKKPVRLAQMTGLESLAYEIIKQALKDYKSSASAQIFFKGLWFETLCDFLEVNPDVIRQRLKQNFNNNKGDSK